MTKIIRSANELKLKNKSIGFVPTMGALHRGHESLLQKSRRENEISILSIFVNPTQFNNPKDLETYPKTFDQDLALANKNQVDYLFFPEFSEIYQDNYRFKLTESHFSNLLCGKFRPGHFDGVLTVVMKLLNIVNPTISYFGEKDYQQFLLIRDMAKNFFMRTEICPCPTVRESDGLAYSSRNVRLTTSGREKAPYIYKTISTCNSAESAKLGLIKLGFDVEYVEDHFKRRFAAVIIDGVRLIDNVAL